MNREQVIYFFPKLFNRIRTERNRFWKFCDVNRIAMSGYKGICDVSAFTERLHSMLGYYDGSLLNVISASERETIFASADQALRHEFDLLGSGPIKLDTINWHVDFKCGAQWEQIYYLEIVTPKGADIKIPWELSRCQHLLCLGEAWLLSRDKKYAQEVVDEINWWIEDNPFLYSVNWKCAMEVAFRAVNWLFALNMISEYEGINSVFTKKVSKALWQHAFFIRNNLERQLPFSNNHYASNIVGLLYLGAFFRYTRKGERWFSFALSHYYRETREQVLESGVHYERSVSYHRMMTEMLSYPAYLLMRCEVSLPDDVLKRLQGMYDYVFNYVKPNGLTPLIADNDDGRFVPLMKRDFRDHEYLNNPLSLENCFVSTGMQPLFCAKQKGTKCYPDAGVAIIREGNNYLFINNGGYSKCPKETETVIGTHTHNDLLSFELALLGKDIIVDPGTYLYTSSKKDRDAFRATAKHNTAVVDFEEQNDFLQTFYLKRNVLIGKLKQSDGGYEGSYRTIKGKMSHTRRFNLNDERLIIDDLLMKEGNNHQAQIYFHFAQGLNPVLKDNKVFFDDINVVMSFDSTPEKLDIIEDTLSPSYGVLIPSKSLEVAFVFNNEIHIQTTISNKFQTT